MPLSVEFLKDYANKKFMSLVVNGGASNAAAAWRGKNKATENGDVLADLSVETNLSKNSGTTDSTTLRVITATDGPLNTNLGATSDAAIVTDTTGSISGKLRGLVKWAFERMPASLGPKTVAASLAVTQAANTALVAGAVTVGTSQVALPASALANRRTVAIYNNGSATIYVGLTGVTTATGFPILAGQSLGLDIGDGVALFGISGTAGQNVRVLEMS